MEQRFSAALKAVLNRGFTAGGFTWTVGREWLCRIVSASHVHKLKP
jgi:hypothetical protein